MADQTFQDLHWLLDIIQSADVGILVLDRHFNVEIFNRFMQVHSGSNAQDIIGRGIFEVFPYLDDEWFRRRIDAVFELGIPIYTTWEQRNCVFNFPLKLPIHHDITEMYQNTTFIPLRSANDTVEKVGIVVYDVTDTANNRNKLELLKDELEMLSRTDKLTSLWNRGYWEERLNEEFLRYQRNNINISMVIFDIDHFKKVNDTYGHQVGDEVIRASSRLLLACSREVDICGRYGGEEFVVILPGADIKGAMKFCERLRKKIEKHSVKSGSEKISVTVSLGISQLDATITSASDWIVRADSALYEAKNGGRNRANVFTASE